MNNSSNNTSGDFLYRLFCRLKRIKPDVLVTAGFFLFLFVMSLPRLWPFLSGKKIAAWDTGKLFHFIAYQIKSIQHFNEFAWWFPYPENGYPGYFYSIAGVIHFFNPFKLAYLGVIKLLAILHIFVNPYPSFLWYQYIFAPILLAVPMYLSARLMFKYKLSAMLVILLYVFGYYLVMNLYEFYCLEPNIVPFWVIYFCLRYAVYPKKANLVLLLFSLIFLPMTLDFGFLFSAVYYFPAFLLFMFFNRDCNKHLVKDLFSRPVIWYGIFAVICVAAGILAMGSSVTQASEYIIRHGEHGNFISIETIKPLNPLTLAAIFMPFFYSPENCPGFNYSGVIILPALICALIFLRRRFFQVFLLTFIFTVLFIPLGNKNPFFVFLFNHFSVLQTNQHITYFTARSGGLLFLLFVAGFGLDSMLAGLYEKKISPRIFWWVVAFSFIASAVLVGAFYPLPADKLKAVLLIIFQYGVFAVLLYLTGRGWLQRKKAWALGAGAVFLATVFIDLYLATTPKYQYIESIANHSNTEPGTIEAIYKNPEMTFDNYNILGDYDGLAHRRNLFPEYVSSKYYLNAFANYGPGLLNSKRLILTDDYRIIQRQEKFYEGEGMMINQNPEFRLDQKYPASNEWYKVKRFSFNELSLSVDNPKQQALIYRDTYDPYWQAFIDGEKTRIYPVNLGAYKGIIVPGGQHIIRFHFDPWPFRFALYFFIFTAVANVFIVCYLVRRADFQ